MTQPYTDWHPRERIPAINFANQVQNGLMGLVYDITARNYGAVADYNGTTGTDCTDIINNCMSDLHDAGGGFCYAPPKSVPYVVKGTLVQPEGVWLVGRGGRNRGGLGAGVPVGTTFIHIPTVTTSHFLTLDAPRSDYVYNVGLVGLSILTRGGMTTGDGIHWENPSSAVIYNVRVYNGFDKSLYVKFVQDSEIDWFEGSGATTSAFYLDGGTTNTSLTLHKCNLRQSAWAAILASPSVGGNDKGFQIVFDDCIFETNTTGVMKVYRGYQVVVDKPYIENTPSANTTALSMFRVGLDGSYDVAGDECAIVIRDGRIYGRSGGYAANQVFVDADDCYYVKVDGCDIGGVDKLFKTTANTKRIIWDSTAIDIGDTPWSLVNDMTRVEGLPHLKRTSSAADPATLSANQLQLVSTLTTRVIKKVIAKNGLADNTATDVFTITTTDEAGSTDGGAYICNVRALVTHAASSSTSNLAAKKYRGSFSHSVKNDGTPTTTAVEDNFTGGSAASASATRDLNTVVMSVVNTSNYVRTVQFQIDTTGTQATTAEIVCEVELIWRGFLTPPVIAAA